MDVSAILDESLNALARPDASKAAHFLLVLSIIDRTILPRRIAFACGQERLDLIIKDRKAQRAGGEPFSAGELTAAISRLCQATGALKHQIRAAAVGAPASFSIAELINAQEWLAPAASAGAALETGPDVFTFDERGWPLRIPEATGAKAIISAWLLHMWMQGWMKRRADIFGETTLMATTAGTGSRELAFHFCPQGMDMMAVGPTELGRLLASWRVSAAWQQSKVG